jgi:uncharacterized protein (DUF488 family)
VARLWTIGYERLLPEALVAELPAAPATALLCLEADPERCHRRLVAEALARRSTELAVIDL